MKQSPCKTKTTPYLYPPMNTFGALCVHIFQRFGHNFYSYLQWTALSKTLLRHPISLYYLISFIPLSWLHSGTERKDRCLRAAVIRPSAGRTARMRKGPAPLLSLAPCCLHDDDVKCEPPGETSPNPARRASGHAPVRAVAQHRSPGPARGRGLGAGARRQEWRVWLLLRAPAYVWERMWRHRHRPALECARARADGRAGGGSWAPRCPLSSVICSLRLPALPETWPFWMLEFGGRGEV